MESKHSKQNRLIAKKNAQAESKRNKQIEQSKQELLVIWHELNYDKGPELIQAVAQRNNSYNSLNSIQKDLTPLMDRSNNAWIYSLIAVTFASLLDAFLWRNMFETIDGLPAVVSRAAGLSLAVFVAIMCIFTGRALKERSSLNNPDEFNPTQLAVFNKRTKHEKLFYALVPLIIVAVVIPVLRFNDTQSVIQTTIFTGISYFIATSVIAVEYYMYCLWHAELKQSENLYEQTKAVHQHKLKDVLELGANLVKIDSKQESLFTAFMNNSKFKLDDEFTYQTYTIGKPKEEKFLNEQE